MTSCCGDAIDVYQGRDAALQRLVGQQTLEIEFLTGL